MQRIHLDGLGRTKDDFVSQQVKRVFKATNFEEVKASLHFQRVRRLNLYPEI